jgi:transcriptional regulator with XRE-family HTH domain
MRRTDLIPHQIISFVISRSKVSRDEIAAKLGITRKTLYEWEYQKVNIKDHMVDGVMEAAGYTLDRIPERIRLAAEKQTCDQHRRRTKRDAPTQPTASNTQAAKPNTPTADKPRPAKPPHQYDPVQAAKPTMAPYEVRFIPSYIAIKNGHPMPRRSDGWYMINSLGVMEYSKTKEEATAKAEAKRAKDAADIADFL